MYNYITEWRYGLQKNPVYIYIEGYTEETSCIYIKEWRNGLQKNPVHIYWRMKDILKKHPVYVLKDEG